MASPERLTGWWGALYPILQQSTPITLALALVVSGLMGWYLLKEVARMHAMNQTLFVKYDAAQQALVALALRCRDPGGEGH